MMVSSATIAPLLIRNILTPVFVFADKSLLSLSEKYKLLQLLRYLLISAFLFCLRLLTFLTFSLNQSIDDFSFNFSSNHQKPDNHVSTVAVAGSGESGIGRALSQLLSIINDIPVSSRKYGVVRSLAEKLIEENLNEGNDSLREVNRTVLSAAFSKTLVQLETAVIDGLRHRGGGGGDGNDRIGGDWYRLNRVIRSVRYCGDVVWTRFGKSRDELNRSGSSAEKLAAELLWLGQKLAACGFAEEAVSRWAFASNLAWVALSTEPRLQGSVVKVSAFLFKQAKDMGTEEECEEGKKEQQRQTRKKMLMSWLPLLCRASNGTDAPVLSPSERAELEKVLEELIETLEQEEEQEKVLSLWLHHFTYCQSSDWPNLNACYARWCTASRKLLLLH